MSQESQIHRSAKRANPCLPPDSSSQIPWNPSRAMTGPLSPWPQNPNPNPNPRQSNSQPPSRLKSAVARNLASSQSERRLNTTTQPISDNGESMSIVFCQQPQSSQTNPGRTYLTPEQQLEVIQWCFSHRGWYADRNITKTEFWARCAQFIKDKFNKTYAAPERMVRTLENRRRQEMKEEMAASSGLAKDELKQTLNKWIEFLDDVKLRAEERKARIAAQQSSHPTLGGQARELLCRRMAKRRHEAEGDRSGEATTESETSESSGVSGRRRKQLRRMREQEREAELYRTALANALTAFGTAFSNSLSKSLSEPIRKVEKEISSLKELHTRLNEQTTRILQLLQEMREVDLDRKISKVEC
ncbi:hypothetical protein Aspvir_000418 [Aspergillus viridinutans]|uniref:Uncharacterized protein n=1 Tax=Aspergillus viridinutans TaxID=75553 RepID=A0A9P3F1S3_ASPVI|nr:uncharacterized protein Aspvir_000418 [Aspergillus viridinutans]GIJ98302.1 hypothetical protein Aspvir_000418 [Aspergillus viridinutans]